MTAFITVTMFYLGIIIFDLAPKLKESEKTMFWICLVISTLAYITLAFNVYGIYFSEFIY